MRYLADITSGMADGLLKSGRMTLRHRTHASTIMAAEKCTRLTTPSSKSLQGRDGEGSQPPRLMEGGRTHHPTSLRAATMILSTSSMAVIR